MSDDLAEYVASVREEIGRHGGDVRTAAGVIIGAASACWSNLAGAGVFESQRASALIDLLLEYMPGESGERVDTTSAEQLARRFHELYEQLAPDHGYETRRDSAVPWPQVPDRNRALMVAVAGRLLAEGYRPAAA